MVSCRRSTQERHPWRQNLDKWLSEREREARAALQHHQVEAGKHQVEAVKQQAVLDMIQRWKREASSGPVPVATAGNSEAPRQESPPNFDEMPKFDETADPTGKRKVIWTYLDERRGRQFRNAEIHRGLIAAGAIPADMPVKQVEITTRRMVSAAQIDQPGRGLFWLPPTDRRDDTLLGGDSN